MQTIRGYEDHLIPDICQYVRSIFTNNHNCAMTTIMKGSCCTGQYIVSCEARGTVSCQHGDTIYTNKRGSKKILGFLF